MFRLRCLTFLLASQLYSTLALEVKSTAVTTGQKHNRLTTPSAVGEARLTSLLFPKSTTTTVTEETITSDPVEEDVSISHKLSTQLPGTEKETEYGYTPFTEELGTTESEILTESSHVNARNDGVEIENLEESFGTGAIVGIIAGIIILVGLLASIVVIAVRKMSGRYTPY